MNSSTKNTPAKRYRYDCQEQLHSHLANLPDAYRFAPGLKTLEGLTLLYETLSKARQSFRTTVGNAIHPDDLPQKSEAGIQMLLRATLRLSGRGAPNVSIVDLTRRPRWARGLLPET